MSPNDAGGIANGVGPGQTAPPGADCSSWRRFLLEEQSDLGLHYLPRPISPNTKGLR